MGNIVNRVFDSSGPEGKVRGTPQQIIEKYTQLARDAQLGNDRVAAENFQQHAEHYARMLGAAQREMDTRQGGGEGQGETAAQGHGGQGQGGQGHAGQGHAGQGHAGQGQQEQGQSEQGRGPALANGQAPAPAAPQSGQPPGPEGDGSGPAATRTDADPAPARDRDASGSPLVDTPEAAPKPRRPRARRPRTPKPAGDGAPAGDATSAPGAPDAAE